MAPRNAIRDPVQAKALLRRRVRAQRAARDAAARADARHRLSGLIEEYLRSRSAECVTGYLAREDEPDPGLFLDAALEHGPRILLPCMLAGGRLDWAQWQGLEHTAPAAFGLREPTGERLGEAAIGQAEVVFVPAAAVGMDGGRLGWGLGYYDRALQAASATASIVALVFDDEVLETVPMQTHDRGVRAVITERRIIEFEDLGTVTVEGR